MCLLRISSRARQRGFNPYALILIFKRKSGMRLIPKVAPG
jgi:hypothetical protein